MTNQKERIFEGDLSIVFKDNEERTIEINGCPVIVCKKEHAVYITIQGKVNGNVDVSGSLVCHNVEGSVDTGGSVNCENVGGGIDAGGSVTCKDVGGDVDAGGSVNCRDIGGDVDAGGSVSRSFVYR